MTRFDLGPCLLLLHYAQCWHQERGPACLVIFTTHMQKMVELAKYVCPDVKIIHFDNRFFRYLLFVFRNEIVQFYTLIRLYSYACCRWPYALYLYDMNFSRKQKFNLSSYIPAFDPVLKGKWPFSDEFLRTYLNVRGFADYRRPIFDDMIQLHYKCAIKKLIHPQVETQNHDGDVLLKKLKINAPYVVLNLNCKAYNGLRNNRIIHHPERYSTLIDFLISKGYTVVIQGRKEQPTFHRRKGLVEYFKSAEASPTNDFKLYSNCSFGIFNKTGPEIFCTICNVPVLGLNYIELSCITPNSRCRFYPKQLWDEKKQKYIHWKDLLKRPCFYDIGWLYYEDEIKYVDLEVEEMLQATQEFLELLPLPFSSWMEYTPLQREFKNSLHPAHLDLHEVIDVPCDVYLRSKKFV